MTVACPFLKWVGGKRQLLPQLCRYVPRGATYYEPFLGGGAAFFAFKELGRFDDAVLNDENAELMNSYRVVRDTPLELISRLDALRRSPTWNTNETYLEMRESVPSDEVSRAVRFIYLNRMGFNGLYRVNREGHFNVPKGSYPNPALYDRMTLLSCAEALSSKTTKLREGDYAVAVQDAGPGDVVYFDPPYVPVSATSSFTSYIGEFGPEQQQALAQTFRELVDRGVFCVLSNSDVALVRELYQGFDVHVVPARRSVNSDPSGRGEVDEVIVVGRPRHWVDRAVRDVFSMMEF